MPLLILVLGGCSKQMWYDTAENSLRNEAKKSCYNIVNPDERRECEAQHSRPCNDEGPR